MSHDLPPSSPSTPESNEEPDKSTNPSDITPGSIPSHIIVHSTANLFRGMTEERWGDDLNLHTSRLEGDENTPTGPDDSHSIPSVPNLSPFSALERQRKNLKGIIGGAVIHIVFKQSYGSYKSLRQRLNENKDQK